MPPVSAVVPGSLVLGRAEAKGFKFTTRQQMLAEPQRTSFAAMDPFTDGTRCVRRAGSREQTRTSPLCARYGDHPVCAMVAVLGKGSLRAAACYAGCRAPT